MASIKAITSDRKTGYLYKKSGSGGGWKKRYFVLEDSTLRYYKKEQDEKPRGTIDLTRGRGVRTKKQCKVEWSDQAKEDLAFGVAVESRTFYIYGTEAQDVEDWMTAIQQVIEKVGKQTDNWEADVEGKKESKVSKAVRGAVQFATKAVKKAANEAGLDDEMLAVVEAGADVVGNQAKAKPGTSWKDRAKKAAAGIAGHGLNMASDFVPNDIGQAAMTTVGDALVDQSEADED